MTVEQKIMSVITRVDMFLTNNYVALYFAIAALFAFAVMVIVIKPDKHDRLR